MVRAEGAQCLPRPLAHSHVHFCQLPAGARMMGTWHKRSPALQLLGGQRDAPLPFCCKCTSNPSSLAPAAGMNVCLGPVVLSYRGLGLLQPTEMRNAFSHIFCRPF